MKKDYWKHHAYIGLGIMALAYLFHGWAWWVVFLSGFAIFVDDVEQEITKIYIPEFRSPLNVLFRYLWSLTGFNWPFKY
jgi:hypothetical protein